MHHVACLRVLNLFYDQLSNGYGPHFREHVAHHQYMMLHIVYQLRKEFTTPPRDNEEALPTQSDSAWYGKVNRRVCTPNPTPQVLQQQVMYTSKDLNLNIKQKRAKVKAPTTATREDDKECHKILQRQVSYQTKLKALTYVVFTQDTFGHQKVMEKLSAPRIKYQTSRMMQEAHDMHNNGCQSVLRDQHYDSIWYRRVDKWPHYVEKTCQEWLHEVDLSYHITGLRHTLIQKGLQRREEAPHNTTCSRPRGCLPLGG